MHLDSIVKRIEAAFGSTLPMPATPLKEGDLEALARLFGDQGYQDYLQDQASRQIIRDYLTNAVMLGFLGESALDGLPALVDMPSSRSALSLHMLMCSVEEAASLLEAGKTEELTRLEVSPDPDAPPNIHLVRN